MPNLHLLWMNQPVYINNIRTAHAAIINFAAAFAAMPNIPILLGPCPGNHGLTRLLAGDDGDIQDVSGILAPAPVPGWVFAYDTSFNVATAVLLMNLHPHDEPNNNQQVPNAPPTTWPRCEDTQSFVWQIKEDGHPRYDCLACSCPDYHFKTAARRQRRQAPARDPRARASRTRAPRAQACKHILCVLIYNGHYNFMNTNGMTP